MMRLAAALVLLSITSSVHAAEVCQDYVKLKTLPAGFEIVSRAAMGPTTMEIKTDGKCTCNDLPAVQRSLGQAEPSDVNWACEVADPADAKGK